MSHGSGIHHFFLYPLAKTWSHGSTPASSVPGKCSLCVGLFCAQLKLMRLLLLFSHSVVSNFFATPWTVACQAPLSMGFPRQENWSGFPVLLQGIFPTQGLNLRLLLGRQILYDWATWEAPLGNCFRDRIHVLFQVWVAGECNQMNPRRRDCRGGLGRVVEVCSCERVGLGCVCC